MPIEKTHSLEEVQEQITKVCDGVRDMLISKNKSYGNSAINPRKIFHKGSRIDAINARIDDKLARIEQGQAYGEDAEWDLLGYLVLKRVALRLDSKLEKEASNGERS